jgi:bifunctional enzyme CysN/CysC
MDRQDFLASQAGVGTLRFMTCGSVDDGKSTLIGRLLHESGQVFEDHMANVAALSARHGTTGDEPDLALLLDGLEDERAQGITIDVAWRYFGTPRRRFIVADAPGHAQYTRNMATAAAAADLAVLLADARAGLLEQTRRHAAIAALMGIGRLVLAINKMDLVGFDEARFGAIAADFGKLARSLGIGLYTAIPLSARYGDNVTRPSERLAWFQGPTLLGHLETVAIPSLAEGPFRLPVQGVVRLDESTRGYSGTIARGRVAVGEQVRFARSSREAAVARIIGMDGDTGAAAAGEAVTLAFDQQLDIARGEVVGAGEAVPMATRCEADLVWLHEAELFPGRSYLLRIGTATVPASVVRIRDRLDPATMARAPAETLAMNDIARVSLQLGLPAPMQRYRDSRDLGGFILIDRQDGATVAAGMVAEIQAATDVTRHATVVDRAARAALMGQRPALVWFTGLSGAGKSTIADLVEQRLHAQGRHVLLLDGDALRTGLNRDLGFGEGDRVENIRRAAEVGRLMCEAGLIVLGCFISPYRADRAAARERFEDGMFLEVFVDTPVDECRRRDPKGLYRRADAGEIPNFTGVSAPYEPPEEAELRLVTVGRTAAEAADDVVSMLRARGIVPG